MIPARSACRACASARSGPSLDLRSLAASLPSSGSSSVASTSRIPSSTRALHATPPALESRNKRIARLKRRANLEQRSLKAMLLEKSRPDPVLGHQKTPEGEAAWRASELAKLLLSKEEVWGVTLDKTGNLKPSPADASQGQRQPHLFDVRSSADARELGGPERLNFGLNRDARLTLFTALPTVMKEDRLLDSVHLGAAGLSERVPGAMSSETGTSYNATSSLAQDMEVIESEEDASADTLSRILDLRNASGRGIQVENVRRIVEHFGARERGDLRGPDTGSPEVQAALLTYRVRNLVEHLSTKPHDNHNRRTMAMLVHQRAKILKYLKRVSPDRYHDFLPRIGVEARAVEGEVVIPGREKDVRL